MANTTHGGVTLIDSGQNSKEVTANNAFERITDQVHQAIAIASGDADVTLTSTQQHDHGFYEITGALTANRNLTFLAGQHKRATVFNNTTGGFDILAGYGTGNRVTVPAGQIRSIQGDGTDFLELSGGAFDIDGLTENMNIDGANDFLAFYDTSLGENRKIHPNDLPGGGGSTVIGLSRPDWEVIETQEASNSASIDFTFNPDLFDELQVLIMGYVPVTDLTSLLSRFSADGGSTWISSATYKRTAHGYYSTGVELAVGQTGQTSGRLTDGAGTAAGEIGHFNLWLPDPGGSGEKLAMAQSVMVDAVGTFREQRHAFQNDTTSAVDGIQFFSSSGNISSGKFILRGRRKMENPATLDSAGSARGALVQLDSDFTLNDNVTTVVDWDSAVYDTDGFWDGANPSRLTIPAGVTKVRVSGNFFTADLTSALRGIGFINKNGSPALGLPYFETGPTSSGAVRMALPSAVIDVAPGDYFELSAYHNSGANSSLPGGATTGSERNYFAIEVIEPTPSGKVIDEVQTSDGTITNLASISIPTDSMVVLKGVGSSFDSANVDAVGFEVLATFKNDNGTTTLVGSEIKIQPSSGADIDITVDVDDAADTGRVRVQRISGAGTWDHRLDYQAIQRT